MVQPRGKDERGTLAKKVKAASVEGLHGQSKGQVLVGWLDEWGEKGISGQGGRLAGDNATREREECVERTCQSLIVLTQSEEGRRLSVVNYLNCMIFHKSFFQYIDNLLV